MNIYKNKLKLLLRDYSVEEILEAGELEPIEALELLIVYGALDAIKVSELGEGVDGQTED